MTIYLADCRGDRYNTFYPHDLKLDGAQSLGALRQALTRDYTATLFNEKGRAKDNFVNADCVLLDIDNTHSENPEDWIEAGDLVKYFPGVPIYIHFSKSHNKEAHGGGPRPRYHIITPINPTTDANRVRAIKETAIRYLSIFDDGAKDSARFFYGTEAPSVDYLDGAQPLDAFLEGRGLIIETDDEKAARERPDPEPTPQPESDPPDSVSTDPPKGRPSGPIYEGSRHTALISGAGQIVKRYGGDTAEARAEYEKLIAQCSPPLPARETETIWRDAVNYFYKEIYNRADYEKDPKEYARKVAQALNPEETTQQSAQQGQSGQTASGDPQSTPEEVADPFDPTGEKIDAFLEDIFTDKYRPIPTGLQTLDKLLYGGLLPQTLTLLGAPPGTGKTALATMIFESIAQAGHKALYLNLEMGTPQLYARSLSRIIYRKRGLKLSAIDILQAYKYQSDPKTTAAIYEAGEEYKRSYSPNLAYNPGKLSTNLDTLMGSINTLANHMEQNGEQAPFICIDYLQLLSAEKEESTETIKRAVYLLKKYAIDHNAIVLAIVAQSRAANKSKEARQDAGRDTSALEYTADVQLELKIDKEKTEERKDKIYINLYLTKSRFTATRTQQAQRWRFYGGQSYLEPVDENAPEDPYQGREL